MQHFLLILFCLFLLAAGSPVMAGDTVHRGLHGPESVTGKLRAKAKTVPGLLREKPLPVMQDWLDWKLAVKQDHGLDFAADYKFLYQSATDSPGQAVSAGGVVDFYGRWLLLDGDGYSGTFGFSFDNRHKVTDTSPGSFSDQVGSQWSTADGWGVRQFAWKQWWWEQAFADKKIHLTVGKLNPGSYYDQNRLADADHYFLSYGLADNPAGNQPSEGLGVNLAADVGEWLLTAGMHDANGKTTNFGFETIDRKQFYVEGQVSRQVDWDDLKGTWRASWWHQPPGKEEDRMAGSGFLAGFDQELAKVGGYTAIGAVRYGYQGDKAVATEQFLSVSAVVEGLYGSKGNGAGMGVTWGEPSTEGLRDQYVFETFMRFQLTPSLQCSPDIQFIVHPTDAPGVSNVGIVSLRLVLTL